MEGPIAPLRPRALDVIEALSEPGLAPLGLLDDMAALDHFPCIADELEEQAKLLEDEWLLSGQLLFGPRPRPGPAGAQQHAAREEAALRRREQQMQQQIVKQQQQQQQQQTTPDAAPQRQGSGLREEPVTPQRNSAAHDSSWSESRLPEGPLRDSGEVQSPASLCVNLPPPSRPALQLAISNAQSVRLGREPRPGAWCGCSRNPWCSLAPRHADACAPVATVPGLRAYPPAELFQSGVNVEELCREPDEPDSSLAPDTESEGEGGRAGAADCLSSGKRRADDGASLSQSGARSASSDPAAVEQPAKRARGSPAPDSPFPVLDSAAAQPSALDTPPALPAPQLLGPPSLAASMAALLHSDAAPAGPMVPVALPPLPLPPLPSSALTGGGGMPQFAPPVPLLGAYLRNLGRPAGAPRLRPLPAAAAPPPAEGKPGAGAVPAPAPSAAKPTTRQKHGHSAAPAAPRASGRRTVLQWHTDTVTDPRTGATVSVVQPGTFCTQCYALSTPVWRAGPFGCKTLCNACGVRWMKYAKGSKK